MHTWDMTHSQVWHDSFVRVTWLIHTCIMTHAYVGHDSFTRVTWLIHTCGSASQRPLEMTCVCDMTHSYVWRNSFIRVTWRIHTCDMAHSYVWQRDKPTISPRNMCVWHDAFICVTGPIHMCDMTHSYVWQCEKPTRSLPSKMHVWHEETYKRDNSFAFTCLCSEATRVIVFHTVIVFTGLFCKRDL